MSETCRCTHHRNTHSIDRDGHHGGCRVLFCQCEKFEPTEEEDADMPFDLSDPNTRVVWMPHGSMADPSKPTAAELNRGVLIREEDA